MPTRKWQLFLSGLFRFGLYGLPVSAIVVTGSALVWGGSGAAHGVAQVYGGPTEGVSELALRVRAFTFDAAAPGSEIESLQGSVELLLRFGDGGESRTTAALSDGIAEAKLTFSRAIHGPLTLVVSASESGAELARGQIGLGVSEWSRTATTRGGWLEPAPEEPFALRVAIEEGVLAVPFPGTLLVEVAAEATPIEIEVEALGAEVLGQATLRREIPSGVPHGLRLPIVALEHAATLSVRARRDGREAEWRGALQVVPGALNVVRTFDDLVIRSPIPRQSAYLSVVSKTQRLFGSVISLTPDAGGGAIGQVRFNSGEAPIWAVISSEFDDQASGLVGWPLHTVDRASLTPRVTFDVRDRLLLDGFAMARSRHRATIERVRWMAAGYCFLAGVIGALLVFWRRPSRQGASEATVLPFLVSASIGSRLLAASCVLLGFSLLAVFVLLRV